MNNEKMIKKSEKLTKYNKITTVLRKYVRITLPGQIFENYQLKKSTNKR